MHRRASGYHPVASPCDSGPCNRRGGPGSPERFRRVLEKKAIYELNIVQNYYHRKGEALDFLLRFEKAAVILSTIPGGHA